MSELDRVPALTTTRGATGDDPLSGPPAIIDPRDQRSTAWRAFLMAHSLVSRRLDDELRLGQGISLAEYDALVQLAYSPDRRLRMSQLADRVLLSRSGVTRLVDRLEADGLVSRISCPSDARGAQAVLTDAGLAKLRTAADTHLRGVERYFFAALTAEDLDALERALDAVIVRAAQGTAFEGCSAHTSADGVETRQGT